MQPTTDHDTIRAQRKANLQKLSALGYAPAVVPHDRTGTLGETLAAFAEGCPARVAGRLAARREMGRSLFAHLQEGRERLQVYVRRDEVGDTAFRAFRTLDLGDIIGVSGTLFRTRSGEPSLRVGAWQLLAKALRPPPEKWHGLQDLETRYRRRHLDLISNRDVMALFERRAAVLRAIRSFLHTRGYMEVETPMMQPLAGGAAARPFRTHYQALGTDMFLRIAPELYLKRLLVGGYDKIFELNRNFRNEGLDRTHNPEFTMLEAYQAHGDRRTMQQLVQDLLVHVAQEVYGTLKVGSPERPIDLTPPWREVAYRDLVLEAAGPDWYELTPVEAARRAQGMGATEATGAMSHAGITHEVYEKVIEKTLVRPTFVIRLPAWLVPLARACDDDPETVDVFELEIGGQEMAPGYSELNDALEQRLRFEAQRARGGGAVDEDFLEALECGMPPAGGMGLGIDRVMMMLEGREAIRDVILFPQLKPLAAAATAPCSAPDEDNP